MMSLAKNLISPLLLRCTTYVPVMQLAHLQTFEKPSKKLKIDFPERKRLKVVDKVPQYGPSIKHFRTQKKLRLMRGPEEIHNKLLHKQYGIVAVTGGRLKYGHFEMIRMTLGKKMTMKDVFAIWRIDPPWQPVTKKGQGQRMGGGKGPIDHYVTPIKAGRVIIEVAGHIEFFEIERVLKDIAAKLPFAARAVTHQMLEEEELEEKRAETENLHPWTWKYIIQNNIGGCHNWISPVDKIWFNKHR